MKKRYEIRLSGSGGQGLILSSIILGEAASEAGMYVSQSQSFGPEARGGASRAEVIISADPIDYPLVITPDIFLALTQEAYEKYRYAVKENSIIVLDEAVSCKLYRTFVYRFPILRTARLELENVISANMICLGILNKLCLLLEDHLIEKYIRARVPRHTVNINIKAFRLGQYMIK